MSPRDLRGARDDFEWNLRASIRIQEAVRFLEGVGELRVAKTAEHRDVRDHLEQPMKALLEFFRRSGARVAPRGGLRCLDRRRIRDATEFREDDRLAAMRITIQRQHAPAGTTAVEQLLTLHLR